MANRIEQAAQALVSYHQWFHFAAARLLKCKLVKRKNQLVISAPDRRWKGVWIALAPLLFEAVILAASLLLWKQLAVTARQHVFFALLVWSELCWRLLCRQDIVNIYGYLAFGKWPEFSRLPAK